MFPQKKASSMNSHERPMCVQGDSALVLTTDPKPRLSWTVELHERFVDAVRQLGGADSAYIHLSIGHTEDHHESDGVKGLTLYHLKSHLQKFRLGKQPHKEFNDHSMKDGERASSLELQRNTASSSSGMLGRTMNECVSSHMFSLFILPSPLMNSCLSNPCRRKHAAAAAGGYNKPAMGPEVSAMKDFGPPPPPRMNFSPLQDLNMYGGGDQLELHHHTMERSTVDHVFMPSMNDSFLIGKKRPNPYSNENSSSGKSPLISWADDLRLQELGTASSSSCLDEHQIHQITPLSIDRAGGDVDSVSDIYETKPMDLFLGTKNRKLRRRSRGPPPVRRRRRG
ncbi:UNVERIFIED_CONTAM: Myb family transcription factor IPN2 [Sesamum angustifolium]|uniref:Myb family transcription factor IPN2 n=1 Tax=Sesamum angustifolium TaxID=2727405 RepID=A0AAW2KV17_9LAMI